MFIFLFQNYNIFSSVIHYNTPFIALQPNYCGFSAISDIFSFCIDLSLQKEYNNTINIIYRLSTFFCSLN